MLSYGEVNLRNTVVTASRIGVCSKDVLFESTVLETSGRGCQSEDGFGGGKGSPLCSGNGGSHGG